MENNRTLNRDEGIFKMKSTPKQKRYKADMEQLTDLISGKTVFVIPKKLTLMGETYTTKVTKTLFMNGKNVNGYIDHVKKIIHIKEQAHADRTYIHEVIHARDKFFGWKRNTPELDKESLVRIETEWWLQYFNQIFPVAELFNKTNTTGETDPQVELIKKLQLDVKHKDKTIKTLKAKIRRLKK